MGKAKVVPDVRLKCAGRLIEGIGQSVGLCFIGLIPDQLRSSFQVADGRIKAAEGDPAMPPVAE